MADDAPETDTPELTPASKNIWYALATIAGEPKDITDTRFYQKNRHYWNGFMREISTPQESTQIDDLKWNSKFLPVLSPKEKTYVIQTLQARGFDPQDLEKSQIIDFSETRFHCLQLSYCIFPKPISFKGSTFEKSVLLSQCSFLSERAIFVYCKFQGSAFFNESEFLGNVLFNGSKFHGNAQFNGTVFKRRLDFGHVHNTPKGKQYTVFEKDPPTFFNAKVTEDMSWAGTLFPKNKKLIEEEITGHIDAYERLGLMMGKLDKHHDKHKFYRHEMQARRQLEKWWRASSILNWAYEKISDYGYGVGRTISLWSGNILLGAVLLFFQRVQPGEINTNVWNSLATSFSNAHGFLGLNRGPLRGVVDDYQTLDMVIPFSVIATVQTIAGAVFLFFLLLSLRNKFKMG